MLALMRSLLPGVLSTILLGAGLGSSMAVQAARVYDNSTTDTLHTFIYSAGGYSQIGDVVVLGGTNRLLTEAAVQFYNAADSSGSFSVELRLYASGAPVGALLGTYSLAGINIGGYEIQTVSFTGLNLVVPDVMAFAVSVSNVGSLDLGLNAFEPPSLGSSDASKLLTNSGGGLVLAAATSGQGNLYFMAHASPVPEPSGMVLAALGLLVVARAARRR